MARISVGDVFADISPNRSKRVMTAANHDNIVSETAKIPERSNRITVHGGDIPGYRAAAESLCVVGGPVCAKFNDVERLRKVLHAANVPTGKSHESVIAAGMKHFKSADELEMWTHPSLKKLSVATSGRFKPFGPHDSVQLLNNHNIDETLKLYETNSQEMFGIKFKAIPFQMIDFAEVGTELSNDNLVYDLIQNKYDAFAVVLNTDVSSGRGKHWFCIFGDLQHAGTAADPYVIEYFNSSGNPPMSPVAVWIEKTKMDLIEDHKLHVVRLDCVPQILQQSHTECGVWSLMYIRSRLDGKPPNWFYSVKTTDDDITAIRKLFFI